MAFVSTDRRHLSRSTICRPPCALEKSQQIFVRTNLSTDSRAVNHTDKFLTNEIRQVNVAPVMEDAKERVTGSAPSRQRSSGRKRPLFQQVAEALRASIEANEFSIGSPLPVEEKLCEQFGVSRHTIREAVRQLAELGLVERRQGSGTYVTSHVPNAVYVQTMRSLQELTQYAQNTHLNIFDIQTITVTEDEAEIIPAAHESQWIRIQGLRTDNINSNLICHTTVFVHIRFSQYLHDVRETAGPIYGLVEQRSGEAIAESVQEISALPMPRHAAKQLDVLTGSPALRFVRRYLDAGGTPMVASLNLHPGERFVYRMRLRRSEAANFEPQKLQSASRRTLDAMTKGGDER